ncbi:hypothetical protein PNOK_0580000 [Pyrrhoderma noxium]|uniref:DUF7729 domain-containing protein n=1 Tax=Pyrrhoderma noxium TaxID=2282107 RepID=A0A286UH51_9AGAM|nr:hypothetical protein PNOK_0580000 [Pyrrhoderma noxium]
MQSRLALVSSVFLIGAGLARGLSISSQCQTTLLGVAGSSDASCLNIAGLTPLLVASQNESLIEPVNNWLAGACAEDACTDSQISNIVSNITSGCSSDLDSANIDSSDLTSIIQQAYPTVRSAACLKDTTNNTLCLTSLLTDIQNEKGTLSISNIVNWVSLVFNGEATDLPSYITCSDCVKQAYNVVNSQQQAVATSTDVASAFQSQCGADFTDGTSPTQIVEGTGTAAPTAQSATANGASSLFSHSLIAAVAVSALSCVSAGFFVLA